MSSMWYESPLKPNDPVARIPEEVNYLLDFICSDISNGKNEKKKVARYKIITELIIDYYRQKNELHRLAQVMKGHFSDEWIEKLTGVRL